MPKAKVETVIATSGGWQQTKVEVGERGQTKEAYYNIPVEYEKFQEMVLNASDKAGSATAALVHLFGVDDERRETDETEQALILRLFNSAVDRKARADVYESLAQESTFISAGDEKVDIMTFPLARLIRGINGMRTQVDTRMIPAELLADKESDAGKKAKILADARLEAEKAVRFGPWKTAAKKLVAESKARENAASGMLEVVA